MGRFSPSSEKEEKRELAALFSPPFGGKEEVQPPLQLRQWEFIEKRGKRGGSLEAYLSRGRGGKRKEIGRAIFFRFRVTVM